MHTHAEISCRQPEDDYANDIEEQKKKYFKSGNPPTILETVEFYRAQKIGLVMFTVDTEFEIGRRRIPNEEVLDAAKANSDMMIAFGSVDPHKGKMGLREVKKLIAEGVGGFKFHPTCQGFFPNDRMAYPDVRGHGRGEDAGHLPQRPLGHGLGPAWRRRPAPEVFQPHAPG